MSENLKLAADWRSKVLAWEEAVVAVIGARMAIRRSIGLEEIIDELEARTLVNVARGPRIDGGWLVLRWIEIASVASVC